MVEILGPDGKPFNKDVSGGGAPVHIIVQAGGILNMGGASPSTPAAAPASVAAPSATPAASPAQPVDGGAQQPSARDRLINAMSTARNRAGEFFATPKNRLLAGVAAAAIVVVSAVGISRWKESDPEADAQERAASMSNLNLLRPSFDVKEGIVDSRNATPEDAAREMIIRLRKRNSFFSCDPKIPYLKTGERLLRCLHESENRTYGILADRLKQDPLLGCPDDNNLQKCLDKKADDVALWGEAAPFADVVRRTDAAGLSGTSPAPAAGKTLETVEAGVNSGTSVSTPPATDGIFSSGLEGEDPVLVQSSDAQSGRTTPFININVGAVAPPATSPATLSLFEQLNVAASRNISFKNNSAELDTEGKRILREIGLKTQAVFQSGQDVCLQVRGFASEPGETDYNLDLSGRRAREVSRFLIGAFNIPANNIHTATQDDLRYNIQGIHLGEQNRGVGEEYDRIVTVRIEEGPCM